MDRATMFIDRFLAHYSSQYYDPAKAHEYYLRNRELQGRTLGNLKTEKKKEAWQYTKEQIDKAKAAELKTVAENRIETVTKLRDAAIVRSEAMTAKLGVILESFKERYGKESEAVSEKLADDLNDLADKQKKERQRIVEDVSRKMESLPAIPKGVSPEVRAKLVEDRRKEIDKIRGDASKEIDATTQAANTQRKGMIDKAKGEKKKISDVASKERKDVIAEVAGGRQELAAELSASVDKARVVYEAMKEHIRVKFEEVAAKEYDAIKRRV